MQVKTLQESLTVKTEEHNSCLKKARDIKQQNILLKQNLKDMESKQVVLIKKTNNFEKNGSSPRSAKKPTEKDLLKSIENVLDAKFVTMGEKLKKSVVNELQNNKKYIDEKLDSIIKDNKSYAESVKGSQQINTTEPTEFRSILQEARNEQLVEEKEKDKADKQFYHTWSSGER